MGKELVKVVVPLYKPELGDDERLSLSHNAEVLRRYPHVFLVPKGMPTDGILDGALPDGMEATVTEVGSEWLGRENGIAGYNRMCLSREFYDMFADCEYILICQTDAWVFRDELAEWCARGYDCIGGVWWRRGVWSLPVIRLFFPKNRKLYGRVGNGGFSLRRVESFRRACGELRDRAEFYLKHTHHMYSEDIFWAVEPKDFVYPPMKVATEFSFDNHPDRCERLIGTGNLPFGCHGWSKPARRWYWEKHIHR